MAETRDDFAWIEAYLGDELDAAERSSFEGRLTQEPTLRSAMREQQAAIIAMRLIEKEQARAQLKAQWADLTAEESADTQKQIRSFVRPLLWGGAIAAVLLTLFLIFRPSPQPSNPQQLAMAYFDPNPPSLTKGGDNTSQFEQALQAYRAQNYVEAERLFGDFLAGTPSENAQFYLALSQMAQQKWPQATGSLQPLSNNSVFAEEVRWNRLLIALHEGQTEYAQLLIAEILNAPRHYKKSETQALAKALDQINE
ncbi:MAG: hypothetical protein AAFN10_06805 [Bacteroidota bacterium]